MTIAIGVLMMIVSAAFVAAPFFDGATLLEPVDAPAPAQLERQKYDAYAAIKEAEFDYQMGKLSAPDFAALREKYATQALAAISALDASHTAQARQRAARRRPTRIAFCPTCGRAVPPRANFCPACGRSLKEEVA
jgi:rRNA maturation endonuclease Nob1